MLILITILNVRTVNLKTCKFYFKLEKIPFLLVIEFLYNHLAICRVFNSQCTNTRLRYATPFCYTRILKSSASVVSALLILFTTVCARANQAFLSKLTVIPSPTVKHNKNGGESILTSLSYLNANLILI